MTGYSNNQGNPAGAIPVYLAIGPASATGTPAGYQQITDLSAAVALTVPAGATMAVIEAEAADVRYRDDGTNPTATIGMPLAQGGYLPYSANLAAIKFIQQASGAVLNVSYYK